jgi:hypothetical protein
LDEAAEIVATGDFERIRVLNFALIMEKIVSTFDR